MEEHNLGQFGNLQLTNVRVRQRDGNTVKSALLTEVNAAALDFRSQPALKGLAALAGIAALYFFADGDSIAPFFVAVTVVLVILFLTSRKVALVVYAGQMALVEQVQGGAVGPALEFINAVENAKLSATKTS